MPFLTRPSVLGSDIYGLTEFSQVGTFAARPAAAAANSGFFYFATDVAGGRLFRSNGTTWVDVAPSAGLPISATTTFTGNAQGAATDVTIVTFGTIPAGALAVATMIEIEWGGTIDILNSATARTMLFKVKMGSTTVLTFSTGTVAVSGASTAGVLVGRGIITVYTNSATGVVKAQARQVANLNALRDLAATTVAAGVTLDTTASLSVTLTVQESVNTVADIVRGEQGNMRLVGP